MCQVESIQNGYKPAYGAGNDIDWQISIEGALAEMALAKHLGLYWSKGKVGCKDVGPHQCRSSQRDDRRLILHDRDCDTDRYYFVTGKNGEYWIRGWIMGKDGKKDEFKDDPCGGRPAYFVPTSVLKTG